MVVRITMRIAKVREMVTKAPLGKEQSEKVWTE